jgi:hypothetical protein
MFEKKCPRCERKIHKEFSYCPFCGFDIKKYEEEEDFGFFGRSDRIAEDFFKDDTSILGGSLGKIMNSLMKQLEKQMNDMEKETDSLDTPHTPNITPRGFKIQISTGKPIIKEINGTGFADSEGLNDSEEQTIKTSKISSPRISKEEIERRSRLPKTEAESNVRRLGDKLVYEISVPGVNSKKDILVTKLEESIEIKAYSHDRCYVKTIPLKLEIIGYALKDETIFVEFKN